jgi:hypothetical protein
MGLELEATSVTGRRSNQLNYARASLRHFIPLFTVGSFLTMNAPGSWNCSFRRRTRIHESARNKQSCCFIQSRQSLSSPAPSPQLPLKKSLRSFVSGFAAAPKSGSTRKISCNVFNVELWSQRMELLKAFLPPP